MIKKKIIEKFPIFSFVLLAFLITHVINPIVVEIVHILFPGFSFNFSASQLNERSLIAQYGGTIAALFLTVTLYGWKGLKSIMHFNRVGVTTLPWLFIALVLPLVMIVLSFVSSGVNFDTLWMTLRNHWQFYLLVIGGFIISAGLAEEFGWRGFLLPQLLKTRKPLVATVIIFVVVSLWHFPALLAGWKTEPILPWTILSFAIAIVHSWLFFKSRANLWVVILFHASFDAQYSFYSHFIPETNIPNIPFHQGWTYVILYCLLASSIIILTKGNLGYDRVTFSKNAYFETYRINTAGQLNVENAIK